MQHLLDKLFSSDDNIWLIAGLCLAAVFAFNIAKSALLLIVRRVRKLRNHPTE